MVLLCPKLAMTKLQTFHLGRAHSALDELLAFVVTAATVAPVAPVSPVAAVKVGLAALAALMRLWLQQLAGCHQACTLRSSQCQGGLVIHPFG